MRKNQADKSLIMAKSDSKSSSLEKWELTMQKLLGVEKGKVWLCWTIFAIKIVCAPLNLIFGGVFYNESSEEQHLPPLMIAGGLLEVPWVLLVFFLYVLLPLKRDKGRIGGGEAENSSRRRKGETLKKCALPFLHLLFILLSVGLGIVMLWMTVLLAGVNTCRVNFNCQPGLTSTTRSPSATTTTPTTWDESSCPVTEPCTTIPGAVFYGGWVTVAFKYLDTVKFFLVFFMTFKHKHNNDK